MLKSQKNVQSYLNNKNQTAIYKKSCVLGKIRLHKAFSQYYKHSYLPPLHEILNTPILFSEPNLARYNSRLYSTV